MKQLYTFITILLSIFAFGQDITVKVDLSRLSYTGAGVNIYHSGGEQTGVVDEGNGVFSYTFTGLTAGDVVEYQWIGYIDSGTPASAATPLIPKILDGGIEEDLRNKYSATYANEAFGTDYSNYFNYKVTAQASDYVSPTHYWGSLERTSVSYSIITLNGTAGKTYSAINSSVGWVRGPAAVDNGDGTHTLTLDPTTAFEYYWKEDGTSEDLKSCTGDSSIVNTDGATYANRVHTAGESRTETFNTCPTGTLSINNLELGVVEFYPNPMQNTLNVSSSTMVESIGVYDLTGRQVLSAMPNAAAFSLNVSNLNKGVYLVSIKADGQEMTAKLVK